MTVLIPTREAGLRRLRAFAPKMGLAYAKGRNHDPGPGRPQAVSCLSAYVRRRLVTEQELVFAALETHGAQKAEKFIEEVFWRGYFKGWLENRPTVWTHYQDGLLQDLARLDLERSLCRRLDDALMGRTGIDCFDAWVQELQETGTLHNHARMWFASIWIFTLGLPWRLGADFFLRHLVDGDAASNTLGWRWVAGLHTRGKSYLARADNIATYTGHRFQPSARQLADVAESLDTEEPEGHPPAAPIRSVLPLDLDQRTAVLLTDEDCQLEALLPKGLSPVGIATVPLGHRRSPLAVGRLVTDFEEGALEDAAQRLAAGRSVAVQALSDNGPELVEWLTSLNVQQLVMPFATVGPALDWLEGIQASLAAKGIRVCEVKRDWDAKIWPQARGGYFKVKQAIPELLDALCAASGSSTPRYSGSRQG